MIFVKNFLKNHSMSLRLRHLASATQARTNSSPDRAVMSNARGHHLGYVFRESSEPGMIVVRECFEHCYIRDGRERFRFKQTRDLPIQVRNVIHVHDLGNVHAILPRQRFMAPFAFQCLYDKDTGTRACAGTDLDRIGRRLLLDLMAEQPGRILQDAFMYFRARQVHALSEHPVVYLYWAIAMRRRWH